jgi:hypothetical protein
MAKALQTLPYMFGTTVILRPAAGKASYLGFDDLVPVFPQGYPNNPTAALWYSANKEAEQFNARKRARPKTASGQLLPLAAGKKSPLSIYRTDAHQLPEPSYNTKHRIATPELPVPDSKSRQPDIGFVLLEDEPDEQFKFDPDAQPI